MPRRLTSDQIHVLERMRDALQNQRMSLRDIAGTYNDSKSLQSRLRVAANRLRDTDAYLARILKAEEEARGKDTGRAQDTGYAQDRGRGHVQDSSEEG